MSNVISSPSYFNVNLQIKEYTLMYYITSLFDTANISYSIFTFIITYIHPYIIGHYNPSVRIIDLVSHNSFIIMIYNLKQLDFFVY